MMNYLVPALIMSYFLSTTQPDTVHQHVELKRGARRIVFLFIMTIGTAVTFHAVLHFPPEMGMMMGLAYLQFFGYFLRKTMPNSLAKKKAVAIANNDEGALKRLGSMVLFDLFRRVSHAEWDTFLFFYGVVMCVGGLSLLGYLENAAGVALMGATHGKYTFFGHLKWMPVIMIDYAVSIATHLWLNGGLF